MAPIKFEEHIREQLEKREIAPSEKSWEELSSRLDKAEKKPVTRWWISSAAAVVVLLVASLLFIENQQENIPVVETPVNAEDESVNSNRIEPETRLATETNEPATGVEKDKIASESNENEPPKAGIQDKNKTSRLALTEPNNRVKLEPGYIEPAVLEQVADNKIQLEERNFFPQTPKQEAVAGTSKVVSEVDALLAEATRDIRAERQNIEARVAAQMLLNEVEYDLDQSFRMEVFDFLKDEFQKAKSAIATRND
ncbi:hypothetical protein MKO06_16390 [Gramella sp. GC03-9]|uniref:Uncharacterized protein n=1 Tax=Christiangramia oceanisediminis TaxID=2920386 RepID=A0A9X2RDU3_9FLAO|nr:hypothetical protein [Gramella oceanisediminis]MCP9201490.1 hypothetical protein [Gramella oceanisediminis]